MYKKVSVLKTVFFSLLVLLGATIVSAQTSGVGVLSTGNDGSRRIDTNVKRLGALCDSLQAALDVSVIDVVPIERSEERFMQRVDEEALRQTLLDMYAQLGWTDELPNRFTPRNLNEIFDAILAASAVSTPQVQTLVADGLTQSLAILRGRVSDDGGQTLQSWGFKFGTDNELADSVLVPFGAYSAFLDTSANDTGAFYLEMSSLSRYTTYYYAAWAENEEGIVRGDTLSFTTLPELASGLTLDTSLVTATSATLKLSISDAGGQGPDAAGFYWDDSDFTLETFAGDSLQSDSTSGTAHTAQVSGLTRMTTYYFNAYADNLAGRAWADAHFTFTTKPEVPEFDTLYADFSVDSLYALLADDGGQTPTLSRFIYSTTSHAELVTDSVDGVLNGLSISAPIASASLLPSQNYDLNAFAENASGRATADAASFFTPALVFTNDSVADVTDTTASLLASFTFGNRMPDAFGFKWGLAADLSDATVSPVALAADSTIRLDLNGLSTDSTYFYAAYADNGIVQFGDTLSFVANDCVSFLFDDYTYDLFKVGDQCWFAENLRSDNFADGSPIPGGANDLAWHYSGAGAQGIYNNDAANLTAYGRLYNWWAVFNPSGLCPSGWHVPTVDEFTVLGDALGGLSVAGSHMKSSTTDTPSWNGTNESGWSATPSGYRLFDHLGPWLFSGMLASYWSSEPTHNGAIMGRLESDSTSFDLSNSTQKGIGASVRCLRDNDEQVISVPTLTITAVGAGNINVLNLENGTASRDSVLNLFFWSSEATSDFAEEDIVVTNGSLSDFTEYFPQIYSATFTPNTFADCTISVASGAFTDSEGNGNNAAQFNWTYENACANETSVTYWGYDYDLAAIGDQCWFAENLRTTKYADGTTIPANLSDSQWTSTTSGATAVYGQGTSTFGANLEAYGRLYNWYAVNHPSGLCPTGWHVPTDAEWMTLEMELGMSSSEANSTGWRGSDKSKKLKASPQDSPSWNGYDSGDPLNSGFSALPGGNRFNTGSFYSVGSYAFFWSSSTSGSYAWNRRLNSDDDGVYRYANIHRDGFSVRCVEDE